MMKGSYKFGLTGARCLILCAAAALIGCAIYLFSVSQVETCSRSLRSRLRWTGAGFPLRSSRP